MMKRCVLLILCLWMNFLLFAEKKLKLSPELQSSPLFEESQKFAAKERDKAFERLRIFSKASPCQVNGPSQDPEITSCEVQSDDYLPAEIKGKQFDREDAQLHASLARESGNIDVPHEEKSPYLDLERSGRISVSQEGLDGSEDYLSQSSFILDDPQREIGIISETVTYVPDESHFKTCQEGSDYQSFIVLSRKIEVFPEEKRRIKVCKGHQDEDYRFRMKEAEKLKKKFEEKLSKDFSIQDYRVFIKDNGPIYKHSIFANFVHKDDSPNCKSYQIQEQLIRGRYETETWEADDSSAFASILGNPNCSLIAQQIVMGPQTKMIDGFPYYRDVWSKRLMFSCSECDNSDCQELRKLGGRLVKKSCLKELETGECVLWEKTYDLGSLAAYHKNKVLFEGQELFGFEGWDSSYEKNTEMGETLTAFASFSDLKKEMEENPSRGFDEASIEIFKGERHRCQCTFLDGVFYDCCKKMQGLSLDVGLAKCSKEEKLLAEKKRDGKCHFVGSKELEIFGTEIKRNQCYCCYSTKLARIINEEGKKQLGEDWGTYEQPNCSGFSLEAMKYLAFDQMDLTEVVEEFDQKIRKEELIAKLKNIAQKPSLPLVEDKIKKQTQKLVEEQTSSLKSRGEYVKN